MDRQYQFNYVLRGDRNLPKVLFLHGFMGSCHDFAETIANLPQFCCLAIDLPDHGQTKIKQTNYQMSDVAKAIITLLLELDFHRCSLVGYSMGGRIALYLAIHFPQYFHGLVLESASAGLSSQLERDRRIVRDLQLARQLESGSLADFLQRWYANPLFNSFREHPCYQQAIVKRLNNNPQQLARSLRQIGLGSQPNLNPLLFLTQLPLLLIVGELDCKFMAIGQKIAKSCPQANLIIVKNTGHNVHFEHHKKFARLLLHFLTEVATTVGNN